MKTHGAVTGRTSSSGQRWAHEQPNVQQVPVSMAEMERARYTELRNWFIQQNQWVFMSPTNTWVQTSTISEEPEEPSGPW